MTAKPPPPVAVACTVKNEERSIGPLLERLFTQTCPPAEVVIADGGSQDRTLQAIEAYRRQGRPVHVISTAGACRGRGRNLAIASSRCELIALTDSGCLPDATWLEQLLAAWTADPATEAVFGVVRPITPDLFTACASTALLPAVRLPGGGRGMSYSVASVLIHRSVWERIGGFTEGFRTGEDLIFVRRVLTGGFSIGVAPSAIVHWQIPLTLRGTLRRVANYSHYGLEAKLGHTWHYRAFVYYGMTVLLLVMGAIHSPWWLAVLAACSVLRVLKTIRCNEKVIVGIRAFAIQRFLMVGWILIGLDAATLYGTFRWLRQLSTAHVRRKVALR